MDDSKTAAATVQVLLSTFNGATYLEALFSSLLEQDYPDVRILVRDDGSTDGTSELLKGWGRFPGVKIRHGENLGFARSFFRLLEAADERASYFAFCDQDDVWQQDKVSRAVAVLRRESVSGEPVMYCGRPLLAAADLTPLGLKALPKRGPSFANALVQNIATGCTIVLNAPARHLLIERLPRTASSHDWWCYLVLAGLGRVIYDPEPKVLYRQHGRNVIGHQTRLVDRIQKRFAGKGLPRGVCTSQAEEFRMLFGDLLDGKKNELLQKFTEQKSFLKRVRFAFSGGVRGQSFKDDLKIKILIALNYL